jgi:hypothetical protein
VQTWALLLGIIGTVAGLMAGGAAIYSLVISHRALGFEKKKWEDSKQVALRVELRQEIEWKMADDGESIMNVGVIALYATNEGSVPIRLTQAWLELGTERSPFPIMSEFVGPCMTATVEPNDSKRIVYGCGILAKRAVEVNKYSGSIDVNAFLYDSLRREYRNTDPLIMNLDMFYRNGTVIEDPFSYMKYTCSECKVFKNVPVAASEILKKQQENPETI